MLTTVTAIYSIVSDIVSSWRGEDQTNREKWSSDLIASYVYCLMVSVNLLTQSRRMVPDGKISELNLEALPSVLAAFRATCFAAGILEFILILSIIRLLVDVERQPEEDKRAFILSRTNVISIGLLWLTSLVPFFALSPGATPIAGMMRNLKHYNSTMDVVPADVLPILHSEFNSPSIFSARTTSKDLVDFFGALAPYQNPLDIKTVCLESLRGLIGPIFAVPFVIRIIASYTRIHTRILMSPILAFIAVYAFPMIIIPPLSVMIIYVFMWSITTAVCVIPATLLSLVPDAGYMPYTGISIMEFDQLGAMLLAVALWIPRGSQWLSAIIQTRRHAKVSNDLEEGGRAA